MEKKFDIIVCGTFVADIIGRPINISGEITPGSLTMIDKIELFTGGLGCNLSIDLAKLGNKVGVMGRIGNDNWRSLFFTSFDKEKIDYKNIKIDDEHSSAATMVCVNSAGERTFFHVGGAHMTVNAEDVLSRMEFINSAEIFAIGYYGCMPAFEPDMPYVFREIKNRTNTKILLETAGFVKPTLDDLSRSLPFVDFWIPSIEEGKILTGEDDKEKMVKRFREAGANNIVGIKLGAEGCYLTDKENSYTIPAFKVPQVIDTTGAGDSFLAGFLTAQIRKSGLLEAGRLGNAVGSFAVQALGASTGIKSYDETVKFMNSNI
jgi:sugar/nucleoside kinase (ribokinase family)